MSSTAVPTLQLNICMKSYHEARLGIKKWQLANQVLLRKGKSIPIAHINNNRPSVKFNEELKYYVIEYSCAGNPTEVSKNGGCPFTIRLQASYDGTRLVVARVDDSFSHNHSFVPQPELDERYLYKDNAISDVESEDDNVNTKRAKDDTHNQLEKRMKHREKAKSFMDAHVEIEGSAIELDLDHPAPVSRRSSKSNKGNKKSKESASKRKKKTTPPPRRSKRPKRGAVKIANYDEKEMGEEEEQWQVVSLLNVPTTSSSTTTTTVPSKPNQNGKSSKKLPEPKKRKPPQRKPKQQTSKRPPVLNIVPNDEDEEEEEFWQVSLLNPIPTSTTVPSIANQNGKSSKKAPAAKKRKVPQRKTQQSSSPIEQLQFHHLLDDSSDDDEEFHGWDVNNQQSSSIWNGENIPTQNNKEKLKLTIRTLPRRTRQPPKRVSDQDRAAAAVDEDVGIWEVVSSSPSSQLLNDGNARLNESAETNTSTSTIVTSPAKLKRRTRQQPKRFQGYDGGADD